MMDSGETVGLRTIIVHYHIFKNAGTSVDRILRMAFGGRWASLEGPTPTSLLRPHDLSVFVKNQPELLAVSSHLLRPPAPPGLRVLPVVLIRHPLDRAYSVYSHLRRSPDGIESSEVAKQTTFSQFVEWCLSHKSRGGMVISDYQVIHLSEASFRSGHIYDATATAKDLRDAIDYLSDVSCLGTVDRFDAVVVRLHKVAEEHDLRVAATSVAENVTSGRPKKLDERLSIARRQLGVDLHRRYLDENKLDYKLYEWACHYQSATFGG
jgi:Sulfotransferase family